MKTLWLNSAAVKALILTILKQLTSHVAITLDSS